MLLTYLSLVVAAAVVLLIAGYLIAIGWALTEARRNVARLAGTLEEIAERTTGLGERIEPVDKAVAALAEEMEAAGEALAGAAAALERQARSRTRA